MDAPSKVSGCRPIISCVLFGVKHVDGRVRYGEGANTKTTGLGSCGSWPRQIGLALERADAAKMNKDVHESHPATIKRQLAREARTHRTSTILTNNSMYNRPTNCSG
jgi:hypothetical protein